MNLSWWAESGFKKENKYTEKSRETNIENTHMAGSFTEIIEKDEGTCIRTHTQELEAEVIYIYFLNCVLNWSAPNHFLDLLIFMLLS